MRLSAIGTDEVQLNSEIKTLFDALYPIIGAYITGFESEQPIEMQIGNTLVKLKWTLVTAESCTGGALASIFTKNPGASTFFKGSVVSYSNDVKHTVLGVSQDELNLSLIHI